MAEPEPTDAETEPTLDSVPEAGTTNVADPIAGEVTRIAGQGGTSGAGYSGDDGPATDARLNDLLDVAAAPDGTIHIADRGNGRVRSIDPDGVITTTVHAARSPENDVDLDVDGWIYSPSNQPISVAVDGDGAMVVGSKDDISRVTPGEEKETLTGEEGGLPAPGDSAPGDSVSIHRAEDVAVTSDGTVYAYLKGIGEIIEIDPEGEVRLIAGGGDLNRDDADGTQPATDYAIGLPSAITVAEDGPLASTVLFTAEQHSRVMAIRPDGTLDVFAGTGESGFSGDGGPARDAQLSEVVEALGVTEDGEVLIGDTFNAAIRQIDADGVITTLHGAVGKIDSLDTLPGGDVIFTRGALVLQLTVEGTPALEVDEPVNEAEGADPFAQEPAGEAVHLAGAAGDLPDPLPQPNDYDPVQTGVAVDPDGNVLFGDRTTATVRRVEDDGSTSVVAGVWPRPEEPAAGTSDDETVTADEHALETVRDLAQLPDGTVAVAESDRVWLLQSDDGTMTRLEVEGETPSNIRGIAADQDGALYLAADDLVQRVSPEGTVETIAGGGERWADDADGHPATEADLWEPADVAVDSEGAVYLTETGRSFVRRIAPDGTLTTVLGDSYRSRDEGGFSGDGGPGPEAEVNNPVGLLVAPDDQVYVADAYNARVRRINPDGTVTTVAGNGLLPDAERPDGQSADGPALETPLGEPTSLALGTDGDLLISTARPERIYRLTGDQELRMLAERSSESADPETPAEEALLPSAQDLAVDAAGVLRLTSVRGIVTIGDTASEPDGQQALRVASGDITAVAGSSTVSRVLPDGRTVLVAGGGTLRPTDEAVPALGLDLTEGVRDIAMSQNGSLFVLALNDPEGGEEARPPLYEVTRDGMATPVGLAEGTEPQAIAAGPDGALYGLAADTRHILRLDGQDAGVVAGVDGESSDELADEPFGTATALPYDARLHDLAVDPHGNLLVAVDQGLLVVDPVEDTYAVHDGPWSGPQAGLQVATDQHANAYVLSHHAGGQTVQVSALVRPAEVAPPQDVPWAGITAAGGGAAVVLGAVLLWRRRRGTDSSVGSPQDQPTASD